MPVSARESRLPLEPEEYPLYRPPRRFGCSGLTIVTLLTLGVFALLFWRFTPDMAKAITDVPRNWLQPGTPEAGTTSGVGALATQTALSIPTPTVNIVVNPTPVIEYVKVTGTGGNGVRLRVEPFSNARSLITVGEGAVFLIIGADEPDADNPANTWRNVQLLPPDGRKGWVLARFLTPNSGSNP